MTRRLSLVALLTLMPAATFAQPRFQAQGFGGVTAGTATFGTAVSPTFGGRFGVRLGEYVEIVGEGGRLARFDSPQFDVLGFTGLSVRVNAWYAEGGARFIATPRGAVRGYGEVTAGVARFNASLRGLSGADQTFLDTAVDLLNTNRPTFGLGGGVEFDAGPILVDAGYRYKRIAPGDSLAATLNEGKPYHVNQVRIGAGIRF
jgi:opacity protein-like surface antigen